MSTPLTPNAARVAFNDGYCAGWTAAVRHMGAGLERSRAHLDAALESLLTTAQERTHEHIDLFRALGELDDRSLSRLLTHVRHDVLARALAGSDEDFRERAYAHMSAHAAGEVCDDIAHLGTLRRADVESAQAHVGALIAAGLADGTLCRACEGR